MIGKFIHIRVKRMAYPFVSSLLFCSPPQISGFPLITSIEHAIIPHNQYYVVHHNNKFILSICFLCSPPEEIIQILVVLILLCPNKSASFAISFSSFRGAPKKHGEWLLTLPSSMFSLYCLFTQYYFANPAGMTLASVILS